MDPEIDNEYLYDPDAGHLTGSDSDSDDGGCDYSNQPSSLGRVDNIDASTNCTLYHYMSRLDVQTPFISCPSTQLEWSKGVYTQSFLSYFNVGHATRMRCMKDEDVLDVTCTVRPVVSDGNDLQ